MTGTEKLLHYLLMAGERALASYAYQESITHFERGLIARNIVVSGTEAASDEKPVPDAEAASALFGLGQARASTAERFEMQANQRRDIQDAGEGYSALPLCRT